MDAMTGGVSARAEELRELSDQLTPTQTLSGAAERARFTVTTVSIVGSAVTAFGVLSGDRVSAAGPLGHILVTGSVVFALLAVVAALSYLTLRPRPVRRRDLADVERWRDRELRRIRTVTWSGRLLAAAVLLGGSAAALALLGHSAQATSAVEMTDGGKRAAAVSASVAGARPGSTITVRATAETPGQPDRIVVASTLTVDRSGSTSMRSTVSDLGQASAIKVEVMADGRLLSTAHADLTRTP